MFKVMSQFEYKKMINELEKAEYKIIQLELRTTWLSKELEKTKTLMHTLEQEKEMATKTAERYRNIIDEYDHKQTNTQNSNIAKKDNEISQLKDTIKELKASNKIKIDSQNELIKSYETQIDQYEKQEQKYAESLKNKGGRKRKATNEIVIQIVQLREQGISFGNIAKHLTNTTRLPWNKGTVYITYKREIQEKLTKS